MTSFCIQRVPWGPERDNICGRGITESKGPSGEHLGVPGEGHLRMREAGGEVPRRGRGDPEACHHWGLQCCPKLLWSWNSQVSVVKNSNLMHWSTYTLHIYRLFHCAPNVPHYAKNKAVGVMKPGHCFTIEPMISEGVGAFNVSKYQCL